MPADTEIVHPPIPLLALLRNKTHMSRLKAAIAGRYEITICPSWDDLLGKSEKIPAEIIVFDLYALGPSRFKLLNRLKDMVPRTAIVAYQGKNTSAADIFELGRAQIDALIIAGISDSPEQIQSTIDKAEARTILHLIMPRIANLPKIVQDAVLVCMSRAHECLTPSQLSDLLHVSQRTLLTSLHEASLPSPSPFITWCRLIIASHFLESGLRSADSVSDSLGFPSHSAFRNTCQRYLHTTPHGIKEKGGVKWVIDSLLTMVHEERPEDKEHYNESGAAKNQPGS